MEYPFSSKEKGMGYWTPPGVQADSSASLDNGMRNSILEDPFVNFAELMNFEGYAGLCNSPSTTEQILAPYGLPISPSALYGSLDMMNFAEQSSFYHPDRGGVSNAVGSSYPFVDRLAFQQTDSQLDYQLDSNDQNDSGAKQGESALGRLGISDVANNTICRPLAFSLDEKMLRALSLFKDYSGGGILAQVWVPIKHGDQYILTTCEQPYLLDKMLEGYREVSRTFTFSAEGKPGTFLGLPGRVFTSKVPEWTSNVIYYNNSEYLRVKHAVHHNIRGSIAVPIFDSSDKSCCAVLELVTTKEKANFDSEMEKVCLALQAVNLRTTPPPRLLPQCLSRNQRDALAEITDVLRAVCHAHRFPLALTWIPCCVSEGAADEIVRVRVRDGNGNANEKCILCVEDTACYVNDKEMEGFVRACAEHYLEEGQGIAGKALQSNHPFFYPDVKNYDIHEYPLVHHARRFGLNAAVAIRLRSTFTGDDDYILEFFLPVNIKGSAEQQLLLDNLSRTMQRICKTLRTVSDAELFGTDGSKAELQEVSLPSMSPIPTYGGSHKTVLSDNSTSSIDGRPSNVPTSTRTVSDLPCEQVTSLSRRQHEKKRSTAEKTVSLGVLQQYFSGSLKDAAKSIGVCPTTLKRICRQHGISRWPSRKINKVNRSLKKIQTVLNSVQGVEGGLKFDPNTGGFVAAGSIQEFDAQKNFIPDKKPAVQVEEASIEEEERSIPFVCGNNSAIKLEDEYCVGGDHLGPSTASLHLLDISHEEAKKSSISQIEYREDSKSTAVDDGIVEHNRPASSSMTDSSDGSGSIMHGSSSSSQSFEEGKHSKERTSSHDSGSKVTVKATYKDDTIRFKFEPSDGCFQLYDEVSKRFKLQYGTFQLKYLDDEDEWVMLVSDSDLQECLEIMEYVGTRSVKFLVRDVPVAMGSSGGSNCFLSGCS